MGVQAVLTACETTRTCELSPPAPTDRWRRFSSFVSLHTAVLNLCEAGSGLNGQLYESVAERLRAHTPQKGGQVRCGAAPTLFRCKLAAWQTTT